MPSVKKNISYNIGYQILSLLVPLITAPYVARVLGSDGLGLYGYSFSISHYFVLFCMLGVLNYGNREISMVNNDTTERSRRFWNIYVNQLFLGVLSLVAYYVFLILFVSDNVLIYSLQSLFIVSGILDISWFYFGIEKFKTTTSISAINKIITTLLIFLLVRTHSDLWLYTTIIAVGTILNNVVYWVILNKYCRFTLPDIQNVKKHLKSLLILFIPVIAVNIYKYIDKVMLGAMMDVTEVGIFEAAEKLTNIPIGFISAVGTVMLPRISNLISQKKSNDIIRYNRISLNLVMFLSYGMTFGLIGISDVFVPLFYGDEFTSSSIVLVYLSPCMLFVSWANVIRTQYLLPRKKDTLFCISVIAGAIVNVISNIILIPQYGAIGAAISTLFAEAFVCLLQSIFANKDMKLLSSVVASVPYCLFGLIMLLIILFIKTDSPIITTVLRLVTGTFIYILLSFRFLKVSLNIK